MEFEFDLNDFQSELKTFEEKQRPLFPRFWDDMSSGGVSKQYLLQEIRPTPWPLDRYPQGEEKVSQMQIVQEMF